MKRIEYTITDPLGIHARPAGLLVKAAQGFESKITIATDAKSADARRIMALMGLCVKGDQAITVTCEGPDEDAAAEGMESFLKANL
ncbi:HPr family phosphocarrier protein [Intestinibacillus massiliensis]|nr:HPr family phosphocarrier protein [Intestinibacillus massiliensis]